MDNYVQVWQTWSLLSTPAVKETSEECETSEDVSSYTPHMWRARVQTARIAQRLSLSALAAKVKCNPATLAAFERGESVLPANVTQELCKLLNLD